MSVLTDPVREALTAGHLAHLVTLNPDGSPQATIVWIGLDGDEIVSGHYGMRQKLRNVRRDSRVVLSLETGGRTEHGLDHYLVVEGRARVTDGGADALLRRLARVYLGPDVTWAPMGDAPPAGYVLRITPERVSGIGPWSAGG
jgi:PPOX class probable F420-dependent enzyme